MTLLNANQRAFIASDTAIDRLIVDRCVDAFDALLERDDKAGYELHMRTAIEQMGYGRPIRRQDRPTAVDKLKTICIKAYADKQRINFRQAHARISKIMEGR